MKNCTRGRPRFAGFCQSVLHEEWVQAKPTEQAGTAACFHPVLLDLALGARCVRGDRKERRMREVAPEMLRDRESRTRPRPPSTHERR